MSVKVKKSFAGAAIVATLGAAGAGVAVATGGGDDDATEQPISGGALRSASAAATAHTGGGKVTGTEVQDEDGFYEVEVTRPDGSQVDVHLDKNFRVTGTEEDSDSPGSDDD